MTSYLLSTKHPNHGLQVANSPACTKPLFTTTGISGVSTSPHACGTGSKQKLGLPLVRDIGRNTLLLSYVQSDNVSFTTRMAMWKHFIVLFGGFYDPGVRSECICQVDGKFVDGRTVQQII